MATYLEIQNWVKRNYGFTVKTCWIAHTKEMCGLAPRHAPNRKSIKSRVNQCPQDKSESIKQAFRHYGMI